jgi:hypothetical protein
MIERDRESGRGRRGERGERGERERGEGRACECASRHTREQVRESLFLPIAKFLGFLRVSLESLFAIAAAHIVVVVFAAEDQPRHIVVVVVIAPNKRHWDWIISTKITKLKQSRSVVVRRCLLT